MGGHKPRTRLLRCRHQLLPALLLPERREAESQPNRAVQRWNNYNWYGRLRSVPPRKRREAHSHTAFQCRRKRLLLPLPDRGLPPPHLEIRLQPDLRHDRRQQEGGFPITGRRRHPHHGLWRRDPHHRPLRLHVLPRWQALHCRHRPFPALYAPASSGSAGQRSAPNARNRLQLCQGRRRRKPLHRYPGQRTLLRAQCGTECRPHPATSRTSPGERLWHRPEHGESMEDDVRPQGKSLARTPEQRPDDDSAAAHAVCQLELCRPEHPPGLQRFFGLPGRQRHHLVHRTGCGCLRLRCTRPRRGPPRSTCRRGIHLPRPAGTILARHRQRSLLLQPPHGSGTAQGHLQVRQVQRHDLRCQRQSLPLHFLARILHL